MNFRSSLLALLAIPAIAGARHITVADSLSHAPLPSASVFDRNGTFIGVSNSDGALTCAAPEHFPLTIRYIGFFEKTVAYASASDTVFLRENITELPELAVESRKQKVLHILAYEREYSTLSSYTDTIALFREKMVDYMLPDNPKMRFKGWSRPRVLNSRSYYQFRNAEGLDSVSDRCNQHFSWADWVGLPATARLPEAFDGAEHTVCGKYGRAETWTRRQDRIHVDVDLLADTACRRWVPNLASFFRNDATEFEQFRLQLNYDYISGNALLPTDLSRYSFNIESRGRGHSMFMFHRYDRPFFVATYTEVYILDKEYITVKEAKAWDKRSFGPDDIAILEPADAPELQPATLAIIDRVHSINHDGIRTELAPDQRLVGRNIVKQNFNIGHRALSLLKDLTGITYLRSHRNFDRRWKTFRNEQRQRNNGK